MASASAAGIGFVNSGALLQAHPKMEKVQLDNENGSTESTGKFQQPQRRQERSGKGTDRPRKSSVMMDMTKKDSTMQPILQDIPQSDPSRFARKKDWMSFWKPAR